MRALLSILVTIPVLFFSLTSTRAQSPVPHPATITISGDGGGSLYEYIDKYNLMRKSGVNVRIDDICISACTLVLALIPQNRICVSEHALFGFHHAYTVDRQTGAKVVSVSATKMMFALYPPSLQEKLKEYGWFTLAPDDMIYIRGSEIAPLCG